MIKLKEFSTLPPDKFLKNECNQEMKLFQKKLFELQNVFYADSRFALLVVFQGLDTAGKDGTIRHVMSCMNPMGVDVKSFKEPSPEELRHDFLWRIYPHFPAKGMIEVFNRSYYEDILIPSIAKTLTKKQSNSRCEFVNLVEQHLEKSNIHILKFFLHVSKEEQEKRIGERQTEPHKRWKYSENDKIVASEWDDYMKVYDMIMNNCNNPEWHVIPADNRWYRNYAVAKILTEHLESLHLKYPE